MRGRRLFINGKYLGAGPTGVHRVADELIAQLASRRDELAGLFAEPTTIVVPRTVAKSRHQFEMKQAGFLTGQLWEQLDLPRAARSGLLLSLCNLAPMISTSAVTMIHDAQTFSTPESYSSAFARWYRYVLPTIGRRHRKILAVSHFTAKQLVDFGVTTADRIAVVPNGVDHVLRVPSEPGIFDRLQLGETKFIVALANTQRHKNVGLLLKAFADERLKPVRLVLVGGEGAQAFAALGHVVPDNVRFAGRVSDGELRALLERAVCVAFPSTTEGFGLPPLEGMLLGCPAVVAPCGALPEVCGDSAIYASADDPREWVEAISSLANDPLCWNRYSQNGRERANIFTWRAAGDRLMDVLRSIQGTQI